MSTTATERLDLLLAPSDLWRRHGPLNLLLTLGMPAAALVLAVVLVAKDGVSTTSGLVVAALLAAPLWNRQVLRSTLAVVSARPYLTLGDFGIQVHGCLFDSVQFAWSDIEVMSPGPQRIRSSLEAGGLVAITLRVRRHAWSLSSHQHPVHRNHFQISGYFRRPPDAVLDAIEKCFAVNVARHEPFLLSDLADG